MKIKAFAGLLVFILVVALFTACKKSHYEDPHNHSLLYKTLPEIQAEIAGNWQIKRTHFYVCGIAGCDTWDTTYTHNDGDLVSFLPGDTVKRTGYSGFPVYLYEKANITKTKVHYGGYNGFPVNVDSVFIYEMDNGYQIYIMSEIKNDSLVILDGVNTHYLIRKP